MLEEPLPRYLREGRLQLVVLGSGEPRYETLFRGLAKSNKDFKFLENASVELRYFRYFNTLEFSANIFQLNINLGI